MLSKLVVFDPTKRFTAEQALEHEYFEGLHFPEDEPDATPVTMFDFEFEKKLMTATDLKDSLYEEILFYHSEDKIQRYKREKAEYEAKIQETTAIQTQFFEKSGIEDSSSDNEDFF